MKSKELKHRRKKPASHFNIKTVVPDIEIPIIKIRRSWDRLIFIMGIPIHIRQHLYIEMAQKRPFQYKVFPSTGIHMGIPLLVRHPFTETALSFNPLTAIMVKISPELINFATILSSNCLNNKQIIRSGIYCFFRHVYPFGHACVWKHLTGTWINEASVW